MSSEDFEKLHEMYKHIYNDIKSMPEIAAKCRGEEKKRVVREFDEKSGEAEEVLKGMDEELLLAPSSFRNPMSTTMRMYRRDLGKLQRDMKSTDLGLGFGARGESKYGAYTAENEHSVRDGRAALPKKLQLNNKTSRRNH